MADIACSGTTWRAWRRTDNRAVKSAVVEPMLPTLVETAPGVSAAGDWFGKALFGS